MIDRNLQTIQSDNDFFAFTRAKQRLSEDSVQFMSADGITDEEIEEALNRLDVAIAMQGFDF